MLNRKKILVVDDESEIGRLLQLFLEDNYDVEAVCDPRLACEKVKQSQIDLLLSDVKMPFLSGLELLSFTKAASPNTIVILMTGHAQTLAEIEHAKKLGAEAVIFKPFGDPEVLMQKIHGYFKPLEHTSDKIDSKLDQSFDNKNLPTTSDECLESKIIEKKRPLLMALDDEADLVEVLGLLLEDYFEIKLFSDPQDAIEQHKVNQFKLILTDLNMPQMSGVEFITSIRRFDKTTPIVVISGHGSAELEVQNALASGANEVLPKPFPEPDKVVQILRKLL